MRIVLSLAVVCFGLVLGSGQAQAQYPGFGPYGYGQGHHHGHHHPYASQLPPQQPPSSPQFYMSIGMPNQNYASPQSMPPYAYTGGFGGGYGADPYANQSPPVYYTNNYYAPQAPQRHPWHLGHYLLGN